jgi:predicted nucleic acid-binding protein
MSGLVLDASVVMAWAIPDETQFDRAAALMHAVTSDGAVVPGLWRLEVGNALLMAEQRGRLRSGQPDTILRQLDTLPIETDPETNLHAWGATATLARTHRLTLYDACYLELALRRRLPLASFDAALLRAVAAEGVAAA